jgi:hypothetical protein
VRAGTVLGRTLPPILVPILVAGSGLGTAGGAAAQAGAGQGAAAPACVVARRPLMIADGIFPYVEAESLIRVGPDFLVAGTPTYTWAPGTQADSLPLTIEEHIAARFTLDGRAALFERPQVGGEIGSVRAVSLGGERWGALFDVVEQDPRSGMHHTTALWWAEHDGTRWSMLEPVPIPEGGSIQFHTSSEVVLTPGGLVWVVTNRLPLRGELLLYERGEAGWRHAVFSDDWVESSSLAYDPEAGLWMAHFGLDLDGRRSIKVFRRDGDWGLVQSYEGIAQRAQLYDLSVSLGPAGAPAATVSWRVGSAGDDGAYALTGIRPGIDGALLRLDESTLQVLPLGWIGGREAWIVTHFDEAAQSLELRLLRARSLFGAERANAAPSPYLAFVAALGLEPSDAFVVGPEVSSDPADPFVRSLLLRLSGSCI